MCKDTTHNSRTFKTELENFKNHIENPKTERKEIIQLKNGRKMAH